jgi:hypothetical protein
MVKIDVHESRRTNSTRLSRCFSLEGRIFLLFSIPGEDFYLMSTK